MALPDLLAEPDEAPQYLISGLWPSGDRVLFSAHSTKGAMHNRGNAVRCLADGDPFLGAGDAFLDPGGLNFGARLLKPGPVRLPGAGLIVPMCKWARDLQGEPRRSCPDSVNRSQRPRNGSASHTARVVMRSSRTSTTVSASSGVWIRTRAPIRARVSLVIRPPLVIRPGLGFATAVSFGLPAPAAPLTLAALFTTVGSLPSLARPPAVWGVTAGGVICRV